MKGRQELGDDLKQQTYRASTMTEQELAQLRLDIKVSIHYYLLNHVFIKSKIGTYLGYHIYFSISRTCV